MRYMTQFDGLRAIAVFAVMVHHFLPGAADPLDLGLYGVKLFFILSGFLITGILLEGRQYIDQGQSAAFTLRQFYLRRFLRIFPLYYFCLGVMWLLGVKQVHGDALYWHLTYLSNFYFAHLGWWQAGTAHFWSLAVEEQFYLVWPALILFLPKRSLWPTMLTAVAIGPLYRFLGSSAGLNSIETYVSPFGALDSLALGAVMALAARTHAGWLEQLWSWRWWVTAPLVVLWVNLSFLGAEPVPSATRYALSGFVLSLLLGLVVLGASFGYRNAFGAFLEWRPVRYLGRISYGIYVWHLFMPVLWPQPLPSSLVPEPLLKGLDFLVWAGLSVAVAAASWHAFEAPINRLKRHFPYLSPGSPDTNAVPGQLLGGDVNAQAMHE